MGIKEVLSQIGVKNLPSGTGNAGDFISAFVFLLVLGFIAAIITYYIYNRKQYNKNIQIIEEVSGQPTVVGSDRAKEIILPKTSVRAFYLKKRKLFLPRPSIQIMKGTYLFFILKDGEWVNVGFGNLNKKLTELGLYFDHTDMRMANASLKKLIEKNYKKLNWVKEYAPYIAIGILVLILGIVAFLVLNQAGKIAGALESAAASNGAVAEELKNILQSMDNVCSGSGIRSA